MHPLTSNTMLPDTILNFIFILRPDSKLLTTVANIVTNYKKHGFSEYILYS